MALMDEEQQVEWWLFLHANPLGVDMGTEELNTRMIAELPENIRRVLWDDKTTARIYVLAKEQQLSDQEISHVARTIRRIMTGELRAASLEQQLSAMLQAPQPKVQQLARKLTEHFISPNYFQIAQVYEKKQKQGVGSREPHSADTSHFVPPPAGGTSRDRSRGKQEGGTADEGMGSRMSGVGNTPPEDVKKPTAPPRVIDLRNGAIPSRLSPPPRVAPSTETNAAKWGPPLPAPPAPLPPSSPTPLSSPPSPPAPPQERPPGGGAHGPLPKSPPVP